VDKNEVNEAFEILLEEIGAVANALNEEGVPRSSVSAPVVPRQPTAELPRRLAGDLPPEVWNRLGTKILPKLHSTGTELSITVDFSVTVPAETGRPSNGSCGRFYRI